MQMDVRSWVIFFVSVFLICIFGLGFCFYQIAKDHRKEENISSQAIENYSVPLTNRYREYMVNYCMSYIDSNYAATCASFYQQEEIIRLLQEQQKLLTQNQVLERE